MTAASSTRVAQRRRRKAPPLPKGGERFGAWFDHDAADAACAFFPRYLRHTEAEWYGEPFHLEDWQRDQVIRPVFGWKRADGTRLIRILWLEVPRKNGKTELAAGISLIALLGDGEYGGQVFSLASDEGQAKIVFRKAGLMVGLSEELREELEVYKTSIFSPELHAAFQPFSSKAATKHGFHPSAAIGDEVHVWTSGEAYDVVHKGTAGRRQPLEVLITTAGIHGVGFAWEMHEYAERVRDGIVEDPEFLPVIFAAPPDADWTKRATWRKANPNLGISPKLEFIESECRRARDNPRLENEFRRYHLNQWTEQSIRWLPMDRWDACAGDGDVARLAKSLEGRPCYGGFDLSRKVDLTAFDLVFPPREEGEPWALLAWFWCPEENARRRASTDRVDYLTWIKQGWIKATPGNIVDHRQIRADVNEIGRRFDIREIGFDPWAMTQLATELAEEDGFVMVEMRQGARTMSEPMKYLEGVVLEANLNHGGNPVLRWNASNIAVKMDVNENIQPDKGGSVGRIDGIVAAAMAFGRAIVADAPAVDLNQLIKARGGFA